MTLTDRTASPPEAGVEGNGRGGAWHRELGAITSAAPVAPPSLAEEFGGTRVLVADLRTAWLLVNAARHAAVGRVFGVSKEQENLLTVVVLLMVAEGAGRRWRRLASMPPAPAAADSFLAGGVVDQLVASIAGPVARETPLSGVLLTAAVIAGTAGPAVVRSLRGIRSSGHRASVGFHHRYGYVVDPGHWRQRRAQRKERESEPARVR